MTAPIRITLSAKEVLRFLAGELNGKSFTADNDGNLALVVQATSLANSDLEQHVYPVDGNGRIVIPRPSMLHDATLSGDGTDGNLLGVDVDFTLGTLLGRFASVEAGDNIVVIADTADGPFAKVVPFPDLGIYVTTTALNAALASYATTASLTAYVTSASLTSTLASYATTAAMNAAIAGVSGQTVVSGGTLAAQSAAHAGAPVGSVYQNNDVGTVFTGTWLNNTGRTVKGRWRVICTDNFGVEFVSTAGFTPADNVTRLLRLWARVDPGTGTYGAWVQVGMQGGALHPLGGAYPANGGRSAFGTAPLISMEEITLTNGQTANVQVKATQMHSGLPAANSTTTWYIPAFRAELEYA